MLLREKFRDWRLPAFLIAFYPSHPLGAINRCKLGQIIQCFAGQVRSSRDANCLHQTTRLDNFRKNSKSALRSNIGKVNQFEFKPGVRGVRSILLHRLLISHPWKGDGNFNLKQFSKKFDHQTLYKPVDFLWSNETQFQINLSKLGLTITSQVFIPKTTGNLHISVITADHQQLFKDLRGLGKGIKLTRTDSRWNQIISCSFRS